jgi:hypothetical protein
VKVHLVTVELVKSSFHIPSLLLVKVQWVTVELLEALFHIP